MGPPKLKLQMGRKWVVENQIGKKDLVIVDCNARQSVYVYGCKDSVLQIQGCSQLMKTHFNQNITTPHSPSILMCKIWRCILCEEQRENWAYSFQRVIANLHTAVLIRRKW